MQFVCLNCNRTDEVIGDSHPLCLYCRAPLLKATESYAGLMMSPEFLLKRMRSLVEKHGFERVENGPFKHEREAWTSAVYALALSEMYSKNYWVEVETVAQTPDTYVHHIDQTSGNNIRQVQSIEVVDWEQHVDELIALIQKKTTKAYPSHYCLLITGRNGKVVNPDAIAEQVRHLAS